MGRLMIREASAVLPPLDIGIAAAYMFVNCVIWSHEPYPPRERPVTYSRFESMPYWLKSRFIRPNTCCRRMLSVHEPPAGHCGATMKEGYLLWFVAETKTICPVCPINCNRLSVPR